MIGSLLTYANKPQGLSLLKSPQKPKDPNVVVNANDSTALEQEVEKKKKSLLLANQVTKRPTLLNQGIV